MGTVVKRGVEGEPGCLPMGEEVPQLILQCTISLATLSNELSGEITNIITKEREGKKQITKSITCVLAFFCRVPSRCTQN